MSGEPDPGSSGGDPAVDLPTEFRLPEGFEDDATADLVARAQGGDAQALNDLFARYYELMRAMARRKLGARLRRKEEPEDLAQTTFREAVRDFGSYRYRGEGSLVRWLVQILQNKIRDRAEYYSADKRDLSRERSMQGPSISDEEPLPDRDPPSADLSIPLQLVREEGLRELRRALEELSPEHRQAITLVFFQGKQLREAGEAMGGRSEDAVRMMLRRAEARLLEILRPALGGGSD